jgi:hypothetical protein
MYLYDTGYGRTIFYIETKGGRELSGLDLTAHNPKPMSEIAGSASW